MPCRVLDHPYHRYSSGQLLKVVAMFCCGASYESSDSLARLNHFIAKFMSFLGSESELLDDTFDDLDI